MRVQCQRETLAHPSSMSPIRILELRSVFGTGGGPEKTILLSAARATRPQFDVTVCYIRDERDGVFDMAQRAGTHDVSYVEIRERSSYDPAVWRSLRRLVRERAIHIVHAHEYKTDLLAWLLARAEPVVAMATAHGWTGHSWKERRVYYPADRWVLSQLPRVIAVSEEIRQTLIRRGAQPDRVTTVLNAIDAEAFRRDPQQNLDARVALGLPRDAVVVGSVGRAEPQKRFDLLIDVFADTARSRPQLHLVIAGDGSCLPQLRDQVAALDSSVGRRILLLGHRADVPRVHHALDLYVQTSDYEGTPNAVLEAMAFENPVIATRAGGTEELVTDGVDGRLVACGDRAGLIRAVHDLCDAPQVARAMATAARRRVETDLSFATRLARVEGIYESLMHTRDVHR